MSQITISGVPQELTSKIGWDSINYKSFVQVFSSHENNDFIDFRQESFDSLPSENRIAYFKSRLEIEKNR